MNKKIVWNVEKTTNGFWVRKCNFCNIKTNTFYEYTNNIYKKPLYLCSECNTQQKTKKQNESGLKCREQKNNSKKKIDF